MPVVYRDEVTRVSLASLRTQLTPRVFKSLKTITLEHAGVRCEVAIEVATGAGCLPGERRWLRCPGCGSKVNVVAVVDGQWRGRCCAPWRHRGRVVPRLVSTTAKAVSAQRP